MGGRKAGEGPPAMWGSGGGRSVAGQCWRIFSSPPCWSKLEIQVLRISAQSCFACSYFLPGAGTITCTELGPWWGRDHGASADCFSQQQIIASVPGATSQDLNTFVYQSILDCRLQDVLEGRGESSSGSASFVAGAASGVGPRPRPHSCPSICRGISGPGRVAGPAAAGAAVDTHRTFCCQARAPAQTCDLFMTAIGKFILHAEPWFSNLHSGLDNSAVWGRRPRGR